ncbi:hypothetical protein L226DRAFT_611127 [Lentinus tigrinus ALCF2SS1-7]|uniref:uncharacterized protein n=1 Tax=Lentinus tigrinus ALCF2SS1-7 TaxID=1328758 RepID=UPI001165D343|nr:hypothetical protein L226DRAFT_611127 [Lentinus tigrinus ALCF2SS1-7]
MEHKRYYAGLPSQPVLVARTGPPWFPPTGPEAYTVQKELRSFGDHTIRTVWETELAPKVIDLLDSKDVLWTSLDVVGIIEVEKSPARAPIVLWIGVQPVSLSREDGRTVAVTCKDILVKEFEITDVEVEIRESVVTRAAGPKLLSPPEFYSDPIANMKDPLTTALCLPISAENSPYVEGTGGFYLAEGGDSKRVFLVTARHVVFPPELGLNEDYERTGEDPSAPRHNVVLLGLKTYEDTLNFIHEEIGRHGWTRDYLTHKLAALRNEDDQQAELIRQRFESERAVTRLTEFEGEMENWGPDLSLRILGHVVRAPPIVVGYGPEQYTQDFAIIELDSSKFDSKSFKGNVINMSTQTKLFEYIRMMPPRWGERIETEDREHIPVDDLRKLEGVISDKELRNPPVFTRYGERCFAVVKDRGTVTGMTFGRASGVMSFVREYLDNDETRTSKEWAVLPHSHKAGPFAAPGDSGAVIVDGAGRIGGLLTGGAGDADSFDVTYATPMEWLMERVKASGFPDAHLNPVFT